MKLELLRTMDNLATAMVEIQQMRDVFWKGTGNLKIERPNFNMGQPPGPKDT